MARPERLISTEYSEIMQKSYIDYAMSVIISRALPDVRDGLKPVQRRTLYDMYELGIRYDKPYRKSARIVGDTMGKYHPHGDSSIYEALVVMAQGFKKELPLVDGHGNFGSIEGDGAAAMRYTEARLSKVSQDCYLSDLDKDVVNFIPNFDETEKEPEVLPVRIPNLLINGAEGIAVGMATSIPPHNLREVVEGVIAYMKKPTMNTAEMMSIIQGPDFPTGGIVTNKDDLLQIYSTGEGKIKIRGKAHIESAKGGKENIIITEIPYPMIGANIGKFLNEVYALVENHVTNDITDISNQSSKEGIRIVIELKKGADANNILNLLYKKTRLEDTFGVNMLAVVDGKPETMGIVPLIRHHVDFQYEVCTRKYNYLLNKELDKKEIQEGLIKAVDVIDLIIEILRGSKDMKMAKACLVEGKTEGIRFKSDQSEKDAAGLHFTEKQADAILQMRLYRLIGLELDQLKREYDETLAHIKTYRGILDNKSKMAEVIIKDLKATAREFGRDRRTVIDNVEEAVVEEKPLEEIDVAILIDRFAYGRVIDMPTYERNKAAADEESKQVLFCKNTDKLLLFTDMGQLYSIKVLDLPMGKFRDKGQPLDNLSNFDSTRENICLLTTMEHIRNRKLLFVTESGMIKQVDGALFDVTRKSSLAGKLSDSDKLLMVSVIDGEKDTLVLRSDKDYFLRMLVSEVPEKKKNAIGVRGMKVGKNEKLKEAYYLHDGESLAIQTEKEEDVHLDRLRIQSRDSRGVKR
ncbi:MAG: DNA topoisomerase 4 subunit A [Lachnospiraceae bacterium]|nr:DNA topoisomerase 4 subunit A [Lachnospiraceae bacterium]